MIGRRGKLLIVIYTIFLIVLFLMCSTDLIIREPEKEIYQIAVIIEDVSDDNYGNFRKGMDQAAVEFNADVQFITLYEKLDEDQQMELIRREQQDGVDALVVVPVEEQQLADALAEKQVTVPVVVLDAETAGKSAAGCVLIDYGKMGEQLAERMAGDIPENCPVLMLEESEKRSAAGKAFLEGAAMVLRESGHECRTISLRGEADCREVGAALAQERAVILAGSPEILPETADMLAEDPGLADRVQGLYGRGNTMPVSGCLDRGQITGVCVTDEFSRGYFSVCMAVEALEGKKIKEPLVMDSYYIEKKDLREPKYEKILFPME